MVLARVNEVRVQALQKGQMDIRAVLFQLQRAVDRESSKKIKAMKELKMKGIGRMTREEEAASLKEIEREVDAKMREALAGELTEVLRPFFDAYDRDSSGALDDTEVAQLTRDLGLRPSRALISAFVAAADTDSTGMVELPEFVQALMKHARGELLVDAEEGGAARRRLKGAASRSKLLLGRAAAKRQANSNKGAGGTGASAPASSGDSGGQFGETRAENQAEDLNGEGGEDLLDVSEAHNMEDEDAVDDATAEQVRRRAREERERFNPEDPADQTRAFVRRGLRLVVTGCLGCFVISIPLTEVFWTFGARMGVPDIAVGALILPLAVAGISSIKVPYDDTVKRIRKLHSTICIETLGKAALRNSLLLAVPVVQSLELDFAWRFLSETAVMVLISVLVGAHFLLKSRFTFLEGLYFFALWPAVLLLLWLLFRPLFHEAPLVKRVQPGGGSSGGGDSD
uniref:EF-hand domain-containing protein n=1 Tax=Chromera velia CCMP2878 TaxID=1169474 RepID=A0A0G4G3X8_9ALVE|eukprot:Cvel_20180.t1-p1 / transcript=Cvel_20180.t1 / gene=Cvel_20180 / organism=Chromera_velia_CCMP2878 / gene_product=Probable calcium-binding protein CML17, putative / transcript_product=Probable calcium-binding protein CML17, putative / location=Cvel_scaffold1794:3399-5339(+) / protein_length=456 / sequence_SO=supercontig / SO=protein_coding / is_pseudo=false